MGDEKYEENKRERIIAAKRFAEGMDKLFEEFYKDHKPPFLIAFGQPKEGKGIKWLNDIPIEHDNPNTIKVFNDLYVIALMDVWNDEPIVPIKYPYH